MLSLNAEISFSRQVKPLLEKYCVDCHDSDIQKGGVNIERFGTAEAFYADRNFWMTAFDQLEAGQMPPPKRKKKLSDKQRQLLLDFIASAFAKPDLDMHVVDAGKPVMRRLTRLEYNNTVRDLFDLEIDVFNFPERLSLNDKSYFTKNFGSELKVSFYDAGSNKNGRSKFLLQRAGLPGDNRASHGYTNRGDIMNFSPSTFEKYVDLAGEIVNSEQLLLQSPYFRNLVNIKELPKIKKIDAKADQDKVVAAVPKFATHGNLKFTAPGSHFSLNEFKSLLMQAHAKGNGGVADIQNARTIARYGGLIKASFGGEKIIKINPNVEMWVAGFGTVKAVSGNLVLANKEKRQKSYVLSLDMAGEVNEQLTSIGLAVLARSKESGKVVVEAFFSDDSSEKLSFELKENTFVSFKSPPGLDIRRLSFDASAYSGDYLALDDIGFLTNGKGKLSAKPVQVKKAPSNMYMVSGNASQRLQLFLNKAFRRTATGEEIQLFSKLYKSLIGSGKNESQAMKETVQAVLSSPSFLFIQEPQVNNNQKVRKLSNAELANRLSYFLWSSMPDKELVQADLSNPAVLDKQIDRMLKSSKAKELSESFAFMWLRLDQVNASKPDKKIYRSFYPTFKTSIHNSVKLEPILFFENIIREDKSLIELLDADYTWLNAALIKHYGFEKLYADQLAKVTSSTKDKKGRKKEVVDNSLWFKVKLPNRDRGGIMTMAAPLLVTSFPNRTSPVKRGAWILETLFNRPPTEPKEAFEFEEEEEGAEPSTTRQRFEKHRSNKACYSCHIRLDPPGFALENFDGIGRWRTNDGKAAVDAGGVWNNKEFSGPASFKDAMLANKNEFVRGFVEHLLSYSLGRKLQYYDRPVVSDIIQNLEKNNYRFSETVKGIVKSRSFQFVRNVNLRQEAAK